MKIAQSLLSFAGYPDNVIYALVVRDGQITAVPIPSAIFLLGSGLLGLIAMARRNSTQ